MVPNGLPATSHPYRPSASPPWFDAELNAWVLSRHADVTRALHNPQLTVAGAPSTSREAGSGQQPDPSASVRDATRHALAAPILATWHRTFESLAQQLLDALPLGTPVDLLSAFALPWGLHMAAVVTAMDSALAEDCNRYARDVFVAAATATDSNVPPFGRDAAMALAKKLSPPIGAFTEHADMGSVQTFVALSHTVPLLVAGSLRHLLEAPDVINALHGDANLLPIAVNELLRMSSPARAVFRVARSDVDIGETGRAVTMRDGDRVVLMLSAANHDAACFPDPYRLDLSRTTLHHVALGVGPHHCAGAALVRLALSIAVHCFLAKLRHTTIALQRTDAEEWVGGFAICGPSSLPVYLSMRGVDARDPAQYSDAPEPRS